MTEGRFETTFNLRPKGFDNRKFWATGESYKDDPPAELASSRSPTGKTHARGQYGCEHDHRQRESCPFHDLRAQGCFQYEMDARGPHTQMIEPGRLTSRPNGNGMRTRGPGETSTSRGCGGAPILFDTDIPQGTGPARGGGPWTRTGKTGPLNRGLFSTYEYMPGDFSEGPNNNFSRGPGGLAMPFRSGGKPLGRPFPHLPDNYPSQAAAPAHWRLRAGSAADAHRFPHIPEGGPAGGDAAGKARRREIALKADNLPNRGPYVASRPHGGAFSNFRPHLPDPVPTKQIRDYRPPIFTYHAHQKRQNPIIVPMTYGPQTANPDIVPHGVKSIELALQNSQRGTARSLPTMK